MLVVISFKLTRIMNMRVNTRITITILATLGLITLVSGALYDPVKSYVTVLN
jgi:hypothetical protein